MILVISFVNVPAAADSDPVHMRDADWFKRGGVPEILDSDPSAPMLLFSADDQVRTLKPGRFSSVPVRLTQVVPLESGVDQSHFERWLATLPVDVLNAGRFTLDNGVIRGKGGFGEATVTALDRPGEWPRRPILVIDTAFLLSLYKDEVRTPMVPLVVKLYATIRRSEIAPISVWIVSRNREVAFPLEFGYLPVLVREIFSNPRNFREELPAIWRRVQSAQRLAFFGQRDEALDELKELLLPETAPYAYYQSAVLRFREARIEEGVRDLRAAASIDPDYGRGFLLHAGAFWAKGEVGIAEFILREGFSMFPGETSIAIGLARALAEQAIGERDEAPDRSMMRIREAVGLPIPEELRKEILHAFGGAPVDPGATGNPR
ncbi:MAG: tetratricopeptide repeat protein [Deltaproteobacteria bacterium]|nr:MAG: tetratricopeptide repeat protein [Deltaproteobacteria bacterium]